METQVNNPTLSTLEQVEWINRLNSIKEQYKELHLIYSSAEGWAYISHKGRRLKLFHSMNDSIIRQRCFYTLKD